MIQSVSYAGLELLIEVMDKAYCHFGNIPCILLGVSDIKNLIMVILVN